MPATAAFFNHFAPKIVHSFGVAPTRPHEQGSPQVRPDGTPQLARSSWRAPAAWNDSELLRSDAQDEEKAAESGGEEIVTRENSQSTNGEVKQEVEDGLDWRKMVDNL